MRTITITRVKKAAVLLMLAVLTVGLGYGFADDALAAEKLAAPEDLSASSAPSGSSPPGRPARPTAGAVSHDSVTISWADPGDSSITGYQVLRRNRDTDAKGNFTIIEDDTGTAATTYTDDSVAPATRYGYRVRARNAHGLSPRSRSVRADTPAEPELDRPDLVVRSPTVSDADVLTRETFTLTVTVLNQNSGASIATNLRFYWSSDDTISTDDTELKSGAVSELGASETSSHTANLIAADSVGDHYYGACADVVPQESDTANNCSAAVAVTTTVGSFDLVANSPTIRAPDLLQKVGMLFYEVPVRNQGSEPSTKTKLRFYRSTDEIISVDDKRILSPTELDSLGSNEEIAPSMYVQSRYRIRGSTYYLGGCVVPAPGEPNVSNNCSPPLRIDDYADLLVKAANVDEPIVATESSFGLAITVRNDGILHSSPTTLRYFFSTDDVITTSDIEVADAEIPILRAFWQHLREELVTVSLYAPEEPGTYYYGACIDPTPEELEVNNNCSHSVAITVVEDESG